MRTCYLFGAGADASYGLSVGAEFAKTVIGFGHSDIIEAVDKFYVNRANSSVYSDWYPQYQSKNLLWRLDKLYEAALRNSFLGNIEELEAIDTKKDFDNAVKNKLEQMSSGEKAIILEKNTSYIGLLDEYFHTLISPRYLGPAKFWNVISAYTRAYLLLVGELLLKEENDEIKRTKEYHRILENPKETSVRIREKICEMTEYQSYYKLLRESDTDFRIITTNYTPVAEIITGIDKSDIAYLNGRFGLFESAYEMKVYDVEDYADDPLPQDVLFPFLFIQSGVKPIVDIKQLKEYMKVVDFMEQCDRLVILGYRLNVDDNHINSLIRHFLVDKKKEVIYLLFEEDEDKEKEKDKEDSNSNRKFTDEDVMQRLRIDSVLDRLKIIHINSENGETAFKQYIK